MQFSKSVMANNKVYLSYDAIELVYVWGSLLNRWVLQQWWPAIIFLVIYFRCIKMALVHDLAESIVGDLTPSCGVSKEEKHKREKVLLHSVQYCIQWNLSISDTLGPQKTVLIIEVSLFHRVIYTHLYCNETTTDCPYYRGVLIS